MIILIQNLEKSYLMKIKGVIVKDHNINLCVLLGIHGIDIKDVIETYEYMSKKYFTHATPTINAATASKIIIMFFIGYERR